MISQNRNPEDDCIECLPDECTLTEPVVERGQVKVVARKCHHLEAKVMLCHIDERVQERDVPKQHLKEAALPQHVVQVAFGVFVDKPINLGDNEDCAHEEAKEWDIGPDNIPKASLAVDHVGQNLGDEFNGNPDCEDVPIVGEREANLCGSFRDSSAQNAVAVIELQEKVQLTSVDDCLPKELL